jgi:hypothetical protein
MKISFEDGTYIDFSRSNNPNKIWVSIATKNKDNPMELHISHAEIASAQLKEITEKIVGPIKV